MFTARPIAPYLICQASNQGVVARYHLDAPLIDSQLQSLRSGGADGISLSLWLLAGADNNMFLNWANGQLDQQQQTNLVNLLAKIKSLGFNFVQVAPQFYGPNDFRQWTSWQESLYAQNWTFLVWLEGVLKASGIPFLIDGCAEVNSEDSATARQYQQRLWTDITCWFYPGGTPPWEFTFSFIPNAASVGILPQVFRGLNSGGPVNAPVFLAPHIYRGEQQAVFDSLAQAGLAGHQWIIGECFSQPDQATVDGWKTFIQSTKQPVVRFCPWPVVPADAEGVTVSQIPANPGTGWNI